MADIKNPHDRVFRGSMADTKVARSFLDFYLLEETKRDLDLSTLKLLSGSRVGVHLDESISDLVYSCQYKDSNTQARIIILVEHQSKPDKFMPVRVYDYIFGLWCNELKTRENNQALLPSCHALVFYHGKQKPYPYSMDLAACIDFKGSMAAFWQNTIQLVEVDNYSDERLLAQKLDGVLSLALKHSRDDDLTEVIYQIAKRLADIDSDEAIGLEFIKRLMHYLFTARGAKDRQQIFAKIASLNENSVKGEIMTIAEQLRAEGVEKEKINTAIKCLQQGADVDFIAKVTDLSVEQINAIAKKHHIH